MSSATRSRVGFAFLTAGLLALTTAFVMSTGTALEAQRATAPANGVITGVVRSDKGPEAGVWVIAETKDLPTNFIKIVVTDDQGRFLLPELPQANYSVFVRGYGLVDSQRVALKPGANSVTLNAVTAKTPQEAAQVYPGDYWLSLLSPPPANLFPGTGQPPNGNGVNPRMTSQNLWINSLKSDCNFCHQLGNKLTRSVDHVFKAKPELKTHEQAWEWRLGTGVRGTNMYSVLNNQGQAASLKVFADWTRAVEAGQVPAAPPRPKGVERNLVLTLWDWGTDHSFMHDEITTSKQNPRVNAGGPVYAVSAGHGTLVVLDPKRNTTEELEIPTRAPRETVPSRFPKPNRPSLWWGDEWLWSNPPYDPADPHNPMMDSKGRVWMTSKIRPNQDASWCNDGKSAYSDWYPLRNSGRQASYYDPKTKQFTLIDTCYATHHLQFDNDPDETLYFNELIGPIFGWIDTKKFDAAMKANGNDPQKAEQVAVGWCGQVVDTNGDGKITRPWNVPVGGRGAPTDSILYGTDTQGGGGPNAGAAAGARGARGAAGRAGGGAVGGPPDPTRDTQVSFSLYSVMPSPVDDSVWGAAERYPGYIVRLQRGNNPPESCRTQVFKVPEPGFDPRGIDVDSNGVVWTALAASSHLASFDIRKCKDLTGPQKVDGSQCREGWTLYQTPGPKLKGTDIPSDFHYTNWVDRENTLGLGKNIPLANGSNSDSELALDPQTKQWVTLRVPYPLGFYSRGMDGRIDGDTNDWKNRGLWANYGTHFVWHIEGGKGTKGKMVHFQLRPNPLAR
ncbi:MAG TPA: carboxypeptidase-like regulatory domain-containing protein [Vicinamibacterales bacterium]|nr:carboxypeptidase-like regulatory domain-containing protein [Vicinamibacterales bacterium]